MSRSNRAVPRPFIANEPRRRDGDRAERHAPASQHLTQERCRGSLRETAFDIIESKSSARRRRSGRAHPFPALSCRDPGNRPARARRSGLSRRHACPGRRQGARDRRVRPARHLVRVRSRDHRARLCDREGLGLSHQPRRDVRARGDQALPVERGAPPTGLLSSWAASSAPSVSGRCSPRPVSTWVSDRRHSTRTPTAGAPRSSPSSSAPALLMFAILGIVDARSPGDFAGLVIGGVVVAIIMVLGPITAASLNPARAIGPAVAATIAGGDYALEPDHPGVHPARASQEPPSRHSPTTSSPLRGRSGSRSRAQSRIPIPSKPSRRSREDRTWLLSPHQ